MHQSKAICLGNTEAASLNLQQVHNGYRFSSNPELSKLSGDPKLSRLQFCGGRQ